MGLAQCQVVCKTVMEGTEIWEGWEREAMPNTMSLLECIQVGCMVKQLNNWLIWIGEGGGCVKRQCL